MNATLTPELTTSDRCDRCGAQAYIRASLGDGLHLLFCAHHGREHLDKLRAKDDVAILDETHKLQQEETPAV